MADLLGSKKYLVLDQIILQLAAVLFLGLFVIVSYHRVMIGMHLESDTMMHSTMTETDHCLELCLTAASISWTQLMVVIQQNFVSTSWLVVTLVLVVLFVSTIHRLSSQHSMLFGVVKLLLYAKQRWKFKLLCLWSRLLQQGIIAPRLYA